MSDFDWDAEDVVLQEQPRTAVYLNPHGGIVVRQQVDHDDDHWIFVQPSNAVTLCRAILRAAGLAEDAVEATAAAPKDRTGAERQRRYRQRHARNGNGALLLLEGGNAPAHPAR